MDDIMTHYGQDILQLVYSYVKDQDVAEDLTQEIFIKCYNALHTFKGTSTIRTWLWRIAINHCKDYLKSWYNRNVFTSEHDEVFDTADAHNERVEETVLQKDADEQLIASVLDLPIKYREVIYLFYFEELPIKEMAHVIGAKENTIKTRLKRAKELLKDRLEDASDGE
nr:sigma-70 family RNA polymerase sigma factor [Lentibacillus saliphilus]